MSGEHLSSFLFSGILSLPLIAKVVFQGLKEMVVVLDMRFGLQQDYLPLPEMETIL